MDDIELGYVFMRYQEAFKIAIESGLNEDRAHDFAIAFIQQ
ncbi:MAG: hypothetical protein ABS862_01235 [Carnobacterium inhibens]